MGFLVMQTGRERERERGYAKSYKFFKVTFRTTFLLCEMILTPSMFKFNTMRSISFTVTFRLFPHPGMKL